MFTKEDLKKAFNAARKHTYVQDYVGDDMFTRTTTVRKDTYTTFEQYFNEIVQRERLNEETIEIYCVKKAGKCRRKKFQDCIFCDFNNNELKLL